MVQDNDPSELLEVFDEHGRGTGMAKSRAAVHVDGDWHQAFHCWIVRRGASEVVLQQRSLRKDTFAGYWDASAAGHWRFGETAEQAAREIAEELGLEVEFESLEYRGRERLERAFDNGLIDREHHQIYLLPHDASLLRYRPDPREVIGLAALRVGDLLQLLRGTIDTATPVEAVAVGGDGAIIEAELTLNARELVPYEAANMARILGIWNADC